MRFTLNGSGKINLTDCFIALTSLCFPFFAPCQLQFLKVADAHIFFVSLLLAWYRVSVYEVATCDNLPMFVTPIQK